MDRFKTQLLMWYPGKTPIFEESLILNPKSKYSENMSIIVICVFKMSQTVTFFIFNLLTIYGEFFIHKFKLSNKKLQFKIFINQLWAQLQICNRQQFSIYIQSSVDLENTCLVIISYICLNVNLFVSVSLFYIVQIIFLLFWASG